MWIIYGLIKESKVVYVGQCKKERYRRRLKDHRYKNTVDSKYFSAVVFLENIPTLDEALEKERAFVALYDTFHNGYNKTSGGGRGTEVSEETKAKLSVIAQALAADPEHCEKISKGVKVLWEDTEYREQTSRSIKEAWDAPEVRKKMSETIQALWKDPEYRESVSKGIKALWEDPEYREKMLEIHRSPEVIQRHREAAKALWEDDAFREKVSKGVSSLWKDPEYLQNQKEKRSGENHWTYKRQREKEKRLAALIDYEINDAREKQRRRDMRKKQVADTSKGTQLDFDF